MKISKQLCRGEIVAAASRCAIRDRIISGDLTAQGVHAVYRDDISIEGLSGERIDQLLAQFGKISRTLPVGWNPGEGVQNLPDGAAFVVEHEECPVLLNRTGDDRAVLVAPVGRLCGGIEVASI